MADPTRNDVDRDVRPSTTAPHQDSPAWLAMGLTTASAMWIVGYVTHMPALHVPGPLTFVLLVACVCGAGWLMGRRGVTAGGAALATLLTVGANLLVLGALLQDEAASLPPVWLWLPGYAVGAVAMTLAGWVAGRWALRRAGAAAAASSCWRLWLAGSAVAATALVVVAGGLVTGFDAGFAVEGWPDSFGTNMFLFPLSQMVGGIYYEHAHRLAGTLVGLIGLALVLDAALRDRRGAYLLVSSAAFVMVCVQGFAGGFWVNTAHLGYIVFHGVFGQLVLAVYVALAAMAHPAWWQVEPLSHRAAGTDRTLNVLLLVLVLGQTAMGVVLRKTDEMLVLHIVGAVVVAMAALIVGLRGWGIYGQAIAGLRRTGLWLTGVLAAQLVLGLVALVVRGPAERPIVVGSPAVSEANDAALTTLHQAGGALLLCLVMLHLVLVFRRLKPAAAAAGQPLPASPATTPTAPREVSREPTPA